MVTNNNSERVPRIEARVPNTETNSTRNSTGRRNFRNTGPSSRAIKKIAGETKDVEVVLTLITKQYQSRLI